MIWFIPASMRLREFIDDMKKHIIFFTCLLLATTTLAQVRPQPITGINVEPHDSAWYADQAQAWLAEAQRNPANNQAWKYYFMATTYMARKSKGDSVSVDAAMDLLEHNIKDTYTYNYCKYRQMRDKVDVPLDVAEGYLRKAMEMVPERKDFFDYDLLTYFCATHDDCPLLNSIATEYYNSDVISQYALDYSRNELNSIPSNAIYIGTTDLDIIPKWVLQYGNNEFKGNYCIIRDALFFDNDYRKMVFANLGITEEYEPYTQFKSRDEYSTYTLGLLSFIIEKSGRPVYFSGLNVNASDPWHEDLWYEGLVYRYSEDSYDVNSVRQNNIEHVYDWQTAKRPAMNDRWANSKSLAGLYLHVLTNALYFSAKEGNKAKAKYYHDIATTIGKGITDNEEELKQLLCDCDIFYDCIKNWIDPDFFKGLNDY